MVLGGQQVRNNADPLVRGNKAFSQVSRQNTPLVASTTKGDLSDLLNQVQSLQQSKLSTNDWKYIENAIKKSKLTIKQKNQHALRNAYNIISIGNDILKSGRGSKFPSGRTNASSRNIEIPDGTKFDIIIIAGQSNTHYGKGYNRQKHRVSQNALSSSFQINTLNGKIEPITRTPLKHETFKSDRIGPGLAIANGYRLRPGRKLLIIPAGYAGSDIDSNGWRQGGKLYTKTINRVNNILKRFPGSDIKGLLWSQGEASVMNKATEYNHRNALDNMFKGMKRDLHDKSFIIAGTGLPKDWVERNLNTTIQKYGRGVQNAIKSIIENKYGGKILNQGNFKADAKEGNLHFTADGQRLIGKFFLDYLTRSGLQ